MLRPTSMALRGDCVSIALTVTLLAACGTDSTAPDTSLVGTWDLIGYTDMGVAAVTTGTWIFRSDLTMSVDGTITFPGQPTEPLVTTGTYAQNGRSVTLAIGTQSGTWGLVVIGNEVILTEDEPPPAHTIVLRRHSLRGPEPGSPKTDP